MVGQESLVSIIVPFRNAEPSLERAVRSLLIQDYQELEVLLIDDNSTDKGADIANCLVREDPRVSLFPCPPPAGPRYALDGTNINAGYAARNLGLALARGEWISFQDADDWSHAHRIRTQLEICGRLKIKHLTTGYVESTHPAAHLFDDPARAPIVEYELNEAIQATRLARMATEQLGPLTKTLPKQVFARIPWAVKTARPARALFFKRFDPYPGAASAPFFHRSVGLKFRPLHQRLWPSRRGRGADRDFSYRVALEARSSGSLRVPLYVWDTERKNRT